ncbi:MAG: hypothetical protein QNK28_03860 [Desulfobacterales bacterium]|nr:hypothetical protein [Desulfobacterales bacterium]
MPGLKGIGYFNTAQARNLHIQSLDLDRPTQNKGAGKMQPGIIETAGANSIQSTERRKNRSASFSALLENNRKKLIASTAKSEITDKKTGGMKFIGVISSENPTVSNLIMEDKTYRKECWKIVHGPQNSGKQFKRIQAGTKIFIDPASREIVWGKRPKVFLKPASQALSSLKELDRKPARSPKFDPAKGFGSKLVDAVKPFMGKGYDEIDCYNLVVKGLDRLGVQYRGHGGLSEKLAAMARVKGLPKNAYVNGEGLIKASGKNLFTRILGPVKDVEKATANVIAEMEPLLEKGQILSFSMRRRGHTGIISRRDGLNWTFINSGTMDNSVDKGAITKGVGEEFLAKEVKNWIRRAAREGEFLEISVGKFDKNILASFGRKTLNFVKKV